MSFDWQLVWTIGVGLVSGASTAGVAIWRMSAALSAQKHRIEALEKELAKQEQDHRNALSKLENDVDTHTQEQGKKWNIINRVLGQIEGELKGRRSHHD